VSSLYDQWLSSGAASAGPGTTPNGYSQYVGSLPVTQYSPQPPASTIPFWDVPPLSLDPSAANFSPWDTISFAGQVFPGLARVRGDKPKRIDRKLKKGNSSATLTFVGYAPSEFDVILSIWEPSQFSLLQALMPTLLPKPGKPGTSTNFSPVDVSHPALALANIRSCIIEKVGILQPGNPKGVWDLRMRCIEYYQPTKADQTATATSSSTFTANAAIKSGAAGQGQTSNPPSKTNVGPHLLTSGLHTGG
jgi:hypothetical protein